MEISYKTFINQSVGLNGYLFDHVKDFSCGPLHYKTFYFDENTNALYVGAILLSGSNGFQLIHYLKIFLCQHACVFDPRKDRGYSILVIPVAIDEKVTTNHADSANNNNLKCMLISG
uniref:Uncharacterized protein n=1 Tax=Glossina austeni TaxID=7395 RepID=A0A1A9UZ87_GLOAU